MMISRGRLRDYSPLCSRKQWKMVQEEDKQNLELLDLSREILTLTKEVRSLADPTGGGSSSRRA
jgi:hypothetical protein